MKHAFQYVVRFNLFQAFEVQSIIIDGFMQQSFPVFGFQVNAFQISETALAKLGKLLAQLFVEADLGAIIYGLIQTFCKVKKATVLIEIVPWRKAQVSAELQQKYQVKVGNTAIGLIQEHQAFFHKIEHGRAGVRLFHHARKYLSKENGNGGFGNVVRYALPGFRVCDFADVLQSTTILAVNYHIDDGQRLENILLDARFCLPYTLYNKRLQACLTCKYFSNDAGFAIAEVMQNNAAGFFDHGGQKL